ncbi:H(+)-transporting V0 sector ATPase subunit a [Cryomyces antarcticus]|nr:H(+)-transporting V0 sector ATPase subunit a [Cryomyces antarcticus]
MSLTQLYIANEIGREVASALGELGVMAFRDLNSETSAFQRTFTQEIRRLDNVERQLRYFHAQMDKASIPMRSIYEFENINTLAAPSASEIDELADRSQGLEQRISSLNDSYETLKKREVELTEWRWVLKEAGGFFDRARGQTDEIRQSVDGDDAPLLRDVEQAGQNGDAQGDRSFSVMNIGFVAGVIPRERIAAFERILWRTLRGNLYMNQSEIPEPIINPETNEEISKNVFVIFAHGKEVIAKIRKISESLGADLYSVDENSEMRRDQIHEVNTRLGDLANIKTSKTPPTYNKTNKFTLGFQTIIDAYGTAKYQEVNPGLPTIVTFPFLFAVMFGDFGHGFIMTMAASAMIYYEKPLSRGKLDELFSMAFFGRYIMLMMGIFSMYTGAIYCDIFSKEMALFPSMWEWPSDFKAGQTVEAHRVDGRVYPFGMDWRWHDTENDLLFSNSYKMKLSILLGWAHMTYSLCLSFINARHFKSPIDIWGNFVPGMLFFQSIFGYLVFCIVYKWSVDWYAIGQSPPGLLNMLIYMFLKPGTVEEELYSGQAVVQVILLLIAVCCVPILLFLKPFYLRWEHNKARAMGYRGIGESTRVSALDDDDDDEHAGQMNGGRDSYGDDEDGAALITQDIGDAEHEEFEFSEVMIHQVIHTIEFCLNCVSHTASYLRLWALSLAHQQLSIVLWTMTLKNAFAQTGAMGVLFVTVMFYMWFFLTIAVLVVMEGTSAMLHSLRLHWVEAMSKHFIGDGVPFEPFSFKILLEEDAEGVA